MKKLLAITFVCILGLAVTATATPLYDIWQDTDFDGNKDTYLGSVAAYTGTQSSTDYYDYFSASGHPDAPTPEAYKSKMFLYSGSDGLSFQFIHNVDGGGNNYWNHVGWDFQFTGLTSNIGLVDDNTPENRGEPGIVDMGGGSYHAGWAYRVNTDGGVFNDLNMTDAYWEIAINPYMFGDIQEWQMYSGNGDYFSLWNNPNALPNGLGSNDDYGFSGDNRAYTTYITSHVIPEPTTLLLLGLGLLGAGTAARKKINR